MNKLKAIFTAVIVCMSVVSFAQQTINITNETECDVFIELAECIGGQSSQHLLNPGGAVTVNATGSGFFIAEFSIGQNGDFFPCPNNATPLGAPLSACSVCLPPANYPPSAIWNPAGCQCPNAVKADWFVDCATNTGNIIFR